MARQIKTFFPPKNRAKIKGPGVPDSGHPVSRHPVASEKGAALITVLFMVAVMATLSVGLMDRVRYDVLKAGGRAMSDQARWYALSSERLGLQILNQSFSNNAALTTLNDLWAISSGRVEVPGGFVQSVISDRSNCFNLNNLVQFNEETSADEQDEGMADLLVLLLTTAGIESTDASSLKDKLVDWIDQDTQTTELGAEDFEYLTQEYGYRTANTQLHDLSELRAIKEMTPELMAILSPLLCAFPTDERSKININTLKLEQAPILVAFTGGNMPIETAISLIETRPDLGFASAEDFTNLGQFTQYPLSPIAQELITVKSRYFIMNSVVALEDSFVQLESRFDVEDANTIHLVSRRFGDDI